MRFPALAFVLLLASAPVYAAVDASVAKKADAALVAPKADAAPAVKIVPPPAPAVPATVDEAIGTVQATVKAFASEHIRAGIAGVLCILVFIWRRFGASFLIGKIPSRFLPLLTTGIAFLAALPVALCTTPWSWKLFLWQGLITGAEAMAFWSVVVKFILPIPDKKE